MNLPLLEDRVNQPSLEEGSPSVRGEWVSVVTHLDPLYGGLSAVVPRLASAINDTTGLRVRVAAFCAPGESSCFLESPQLAITHWPLSRLSWMKDQRLTRNFRDQMKSADGIHIHGLWEQSTATAAHAARALKKPYVLSAHGMLESWALNNKRIKKAIYSAIAERRNVRGAACLHALTHAEAEDYRRFGARLPIAVIPNGVRVPAAIDPEPFLGKFPSLRGKRVVLFLGRIHFKKGLDILVRAWATVAKRWPEAHLVIAGPDFEETRASIETLVAKHDLDRSILFTDMLHEEMKWSALAAAQCFVLPSYSEGLSVSTLEAMGIGLPVIVTEQCNLPDVARLGTGWVIQPNSDQLASSLNEFLGNSQTTNLEIGARGRFLVQQRYAWSTVAREMSEVYQWVLGGGPLPQSVELPRN
jgi:glycosyltransferase involved in cell wall biosynthesis